jgi:hypothetical protein
MLITCVDLVKSRLGAMDGEARKLFIFILAQLIEKSPVGFTCSNPHCKVVLLKSVTVFFVGRL